MTDRIAEIREEWEESVGMGWDQDGLPMQPSWDMIRDLLARIDELEKVNEYMGEGLVRF